MTGERCEFGRPYWRRLPEEGCSVMDWKRLCAKRAREIVETGFTPPKRLCRKHAELLRGEIDKINAEQRRSR